MGGLLVYILKMSVCLVMFYAYYRLLLSRTTFHVLNRIVILMLVLTSFLLPLVHVSLDGGMRETVAGTISIDRLGMLVQAELAEGPLFRFTVVHWFIIIYLGGVVFFAARMIVSCLDVHRILRNADMLTEADNGARIYLTDSDVAPFSWFRSIVISRSDYQANGKAVIAHELCHVRRMHSADILLCNVLAVIQWFNPAMWLFKSELQDVHEYEADEAVLSSGVDAVGYQLLLVRKAVGEHLFAIANNLSKNSLKKRISMMKMKKTNRWECMKLAVVFPVAALAVVAFASPEAAKVEKSVKADAGLLFDAVIENVVPSADAIGVSADASRPLDVLVKDVASDTVKAAKADGKVLDVCEKMPSYPGGISEMMKFLAQNLRYPQKAVDDCVFGRVIVSFVVEKDGTVSNAKVVRPISPELDAEAIRVVGSMPKWEPGMQDGKTVRVKYTIPVSFKFDDNVSKQQDTGADADVRVVAYRNAGKTSGQSTEAKGGIMIRGVDKTGSQSADNALVLIDGKKLSETSYGSINEISPSDIESITVLKDEEAVKQYGSSGKNGVIIIKMKSK